MAVEAEKTDSQLAKDASCKWTLEILLDWFGSRITLSLSLQSSLVWCLSNKDVIMLSILSNFEIATVYISVYQYINFIFVL